MTPEAMASALRSRVCHEGVTRRGEFQPCDRPSVAVRIDEREDLPYPVCAFHARAPMVSLADLAREVVAAAMFWTHWGSGWADASAEDRAGAYAEADAALSVTEAR